MIVELRKVRLVSNQVRNDEVAWVTMFVPSLVEELLIAP